MNQYFLYIVILKKVVVYVLLVVSTTKGCTYKVVESLQCTDVIRYHRRGALSWTDPTSPNDVTASVTVSAVTARMSVERFLVQYTDRKSVV